MSADRTGKCPSCGEETLKQYYDVEYQRAKYMPSPDLWSFVVHYAARCDECGFRHEYNPVGSVSVPS